MKCSENKRKKKLHRKEIKKNERKRFYAACKGNL